MEHVSVDASDPIVAVLAWIIAGALRYGVNRWWPKARISKYLPTIAVLLAVGLRATAQALQGGEITGELFLRALASGAMAVWLHSQARELLKPPTKIDASGSGRREKAPEGEQP